MRPETKRKLRRALIAEGVVLAFVAAFFTIVFVYSAREKAYEEAIFQARKGLERTTLDYAMSLTVRDNNPSHCWVHGFFVNPFGHNKCDKSWHPMRIKRPWPAEQEFISHAGTPDSIEDNQLSFSQALVNSVTWYRVVSYNSQGAERESCAWIVAQFSTKDGRLERLFIDNKGVGRAFDDYTESFGRSPCSTVLIPYK